MRGWIGRVPLLKKVPKAELVDTLERLFYIYEEYDRRDWAPNLKQGASLLLHPPAWERDEPGVSAEYVASAIRDILAELVRRHVK